MLYSKSLLLIYFMLKVSEGVIASQLNLTLVSFRGQACLASNKQINKTLLSVTADRVFGQDIKIQC